MKEKLVIWAHDAQDQKQLLAIELVAAENVVKIKSYPENIVTEDFHNILMSDWKSGKDVTFIDGGQSLTRPLSVTDDLLPEDLKADKPDLVSRAKTEWHFIVLSLKLYDLYHNEIKDIKEKVDEASEYSQALWEEAKGFWEKVQEQIRERNLFRDHAQEIKATTNEVFETLKGMRKELDAKFKEKSKENMAYFSDKLKEINKDIADGKTLNPLFDKLKSLQNEFKNASFTRDDRNKVWKSLDGSFKSVKEKKYGKQNISNGNNSALGRLQNRYEGLIKAIDRMQQSINRDQKDKKRESEYISKSEGQLESQLRQAKLMMIDQRVDSKKVKLDDMLKTKAQLEGKIEKETQRETRLKEKKKMEALKAKKKEEIASRIALESEEVIEENVDQLKDAIFAISESSRMEEEAREKEKSISKEGTSATDKNDGKDDPTSNVTEKSAENFSAENSEESPEESSPFVEASEKIKDEVEVLVSDAKEMLEALVEEAKTGASAIINEIQERMDNDSKDTNVDITKDMVNEEE